MPPGNKHADVAIGLQQAGPIPTAILPGMNAACDTLSLWTTWKNVLRANARLLGAPGAFAAAELQFAEFADWSRDGVTLFALGECMMRTGTIVGMLLGISLAGAAQSATVVEEIYVATINNGSVCHAINDGETEFLQRRATSLINLSSDTDIWTVCAFDRTEFVGVFYQDGTLVYDGWTQPYWTLTPTERNMFAQIDISSTHDQVVSGVCVYRDVAHDGTVAKTLVEPFSMMPGGAASVTFGGPSQAPISATSMNAVTIACQLPRNSRINRVVQGPYDKSTYSIP